MVRVGALPPHLNDEQVRELVSAFGVLKHFSLPKVPGNPAQSLGYALIEYEATEITDVAVSALNSLEICGKSLEVKREPASISAAPAAASPTPAAEPEPAKPKPEPAKLYTVELRGVATEEHLADENEYKTILAEVEQECGELGDVYRVVLERPPTGPTAADERALAELTGKVFGTALVSFGERSDALRCKQALDGRKYDGRVVEAVPQWDEVRFGLGFGLAFGFGLGLVTRTRNTLALALAPSPSPNQVDPPDAPLTAEGGTLVLARVRAATLLVSGASDLERRAPGGRTYP